MQIFMDLKDDRSEKIHYDTVDYPIFLQRGLLSNYPNYAAPSHWHDDIELISVLDGAMDYHVNGEITHLAAGEGIFVNSGQMHFGFSDAHAECDFLCILLHPSLLCSSVSYEQDFILPLIRNHALPFLHLCPNIHWQKRILDLTGAMYNSKKEKTMPLKVQTAFSEIWSLLYENCSFTCLPSNRSDNDLKIIKSMVGFIQQNYGHKISLAEIAASGAVGQSKCCKLFSVYFHQSPNLYLTQYRLNKSLELLRDTDMPVTEIALSVGFSGASYYAEAFRKWLGKSPTAFRNL